jgi:hypothetical protein
MNQLQSRKQLLIAESELNRAELAVALAALRSDLHELSQRARTISSIASSVAMLVAGIAALRGGNPASAAPKRSWLQRILKGMGLLSTIWLAFRSPTRAKDES